jgi:uncharacterized repeat protein (TIGR01451 family)
MVTWSVTISRLFFCMPLTLIPILIGLILVISSPLHAAPFTAGNVVIYRVGTGSGALVNTGNAVFLDEYTPAGVWVQSIPMPTQVAGAQKRLIASGTASSEGLLSLSSDGMFLVLPGYDAALANSTSLTTSGSALINRVIGRVNGAGSVDTSTALTDAYDGSNFRGVCSDDGARFWTAGNGSGVRFVASLGATSSTQLNSTNTNLRQPALFGNQLYVSSGSSTVRLGSVGAGLPQMLGQSVTSIPGYPTSGANPSAFVMLDLDVAVAGVDTLYVADDGASGGILKYSFDGTTWSSRGSAGAAADAYRGLTAQVSDSAVVLYATRKGGGSTVGGGELVRLTDSSGRTGTLSGSPTWLATATANTAWRGVALAPNQFDLSVAVSGPTAAYTTASFDYSLTLTNAGLVNVSDVAVAFTLPAGVSFVSAEAAGFTVSHQSGVVRFSGGSISGDSSVVLSVSVAAGSAGEITLNAGAAVADPDLALKETAENNNASTSVLSTMITDAADLTVSLTGPASRLTGADFDYTLTVTNAGLVNASNVSARFTLPQGLSYVTSSSSVFNVSENNGVVSFSGGSINAGQSALATITVRTLVDGTYTAVIGSVLADPDNTLIESHESNNENALAVSTVVTTADVTVDLVQNAAFQAGDQTASYTITVTNTGTGATSGLVTLSDVLPAGLSAMSLSGNGWTIVQGSGSSVSASRSDALPAGASFPPLTLTVSIALNAPSSVENTVTAAGGGELNTSNNSDSVTSSISVAGPGVLAWSVGSVTVNEEQSSLTLQITRTGGRTGAVSVSVNTSNGTASAGSDYTAINSSVTFADHGVSQTVIIPLLPDARAEANETFNVTLSSPTNGASLGPVSVVTVRILDPDTQKPMLTLLSPTVNQSVPEGPVSLTGNATDNQEISRIEMKLNEGAYVNVPVTVVSAKKVNFSQVIQPIPGLNTLSVRAIDFRGNVSAIVTRSFSYVVLRTFTFINVTTETKTTTTQLEVGRFYSLVANPQPAVVFKGWSSDQLTLTDQEAGRYYLTFKMAEGLTIKATFVTNPFVAQLTGDYSGLIRATTPTQPSHETEGLVQFKVTNTGAFSGTFRMGGFRLPIAGTFDYQGQAHFGVEWSSSLLVPRVNKAGYVLALSLDLSPTGTQSMTGTVGLQTRSGVQAMSEVKAVRHYFDGKTPATTANASYYTFALPAQSQALPSSAFPQGDGIGTMRLSQSGVMNLSGVLADGTAITASANMGKASELPLYLLLEKEAGSLNGWLKADHTRPDTDLSGTALHWFKPQTNGHYYPMGWPEGVALSLHGARYAVPQGESVLPDLSEAVGANAVLALSQGGLASALEKEMIMSVKNMITKVPVTDASYSLRLMPTTGLFTGSIRLAEAELPASYKGVILQKGVNRRGFGHFLTVKPKMANGTGQAGAVSWKTKFNPRLKLVISEFMANNETTLSDGDGDFSDWIEIYNPGSEDVDLEDWCLTDNAADLSKWRFPSKTLAAKQFLLVWASGKNRTNPAQPLHTNFSLSSGGEYLALVRPDGVTVEHEFSPMYPAQGNDESYGINFTGRSLLAQGASVKYRVPTNAALGNSWTAADFADSSWTSGKTGLGFGVGVPGFTVRQVAQKPGLSGVTSIASCEALLALPKGHSSILSEATVIAPLINYLGDDGDGNYPDNLELPNGTAEPYAFKATGIIQIPTTGSYVFGLNSDDGGRIKIDGIAVMTDDSNHGAEDNLSEPVTLTAGAHSVEVIMWEGGGGDCVEFFAKAGTDTTWNSDFKLVGSPEGLSVTTPPLSTSTSSSKLIGTNLQPAMLNKNATAFVRVPFTATGISSYTGLTLLMRYNDGFIAYLNGTEVARRSAPPTPAFDAAATATRTALETLTAERIDLSASIPLLRTGVNVLAIHGLNDAKEDGSFFLSPELSATAGLAGNVLFFRPAGSVVTATPGAVNGVPIFAGEVQPLVFTQKHGYYSAPFSLAITSPTLGTSIRYTLDGSTPTATHGTLYTRPLSISKTSIVRAIGFKSGFSPTKSLTQSYFFLNDVIRQSASGSRPATGWPQGAVNGQVADYGMDPDIVNSRNPEIGGADQVKSALTSIPTLSIVTDLPNLFDETSGIWVNPYGRGQAWEKPASVEMIGDSGPGGGFEINCGLRLRGGFSRSGDNPKHSFRLFFRADYGAAKLNYPLFGKEGAPDFNKIDLRTSQNYSWSFQDDGNNTFLREESTREMQAAMGQPYTRSRYYHLYLNGQYWGIYETDERPEANFAESYLGGSADDYDTVKGEQDQGYITGTTDGNLDAWEALRVQARAHVSAPTNANYFAMQGKAADGVTPTTDPVLLDPGNLIDYMMLTFWTGNLDGATSAFLGDESANNWFAVRNRLGITGGFKFLAHDFEHTFFNVDEDRTGPFSAADPSIVEKYNPMFLHHDLRPNAEYRMLWADHVQEHLFAKGALTAESILTGMLARKALLDKIIIAESARWGDSKRGTQAPFTRLDWQNAVNFVLDEYVPQRGSRVLEQLREDNLYPSFDAPTLSQDGGRFPSGGEVFITGNGGTIYYTLDGTDPRLVGGAVNPAAQTYVSNTENSLIVPANQTWKYLADGSDQGTAWRNASFDDAVWSSGPGELGYGDGDEITVVPFVDADAGSPGIQKNATTYFRTKFMVTDPASVTSASLRVKYDDAVIVYLNGVEVMRSPNITSNAAFNSYSNGGAPDEDVFFTLNLDPALLINGENTLAAEVHQADATSSDISFSATLQLVRTNVAVPLILTASGKVPMKVRALNSGEWSALTEAVFDVKQAADLTASITANSNFISGTSASYNVVVSNSGTLTTGGKVTLTVALPTGLNATALTGAGWNIVADKGSTVSASRNDALPVGASYPALTLAMSIAANAPAYASTQVTVSGGGEITASNSSVTLVTPIASSGASQFFFSSASYSNAEALGTIRVTVFRSGDRSSPASVRLSAVSGIAKEGQDFNAYSEVVIFADGEASKSVDLGLMSDTKTEVNESFTVKLDTVTGAASLGLLNQAKVFILENDVKAPTVTISSPSAGARVALAELMLKGTATDDKGLGKVQVSLNGAAFMDVPTKLAASGLSATYTASLPAIAGLNTVRVRALDQVGLIGNEVQRQFTFAPLRPLTLALLPSGAGTTSLSPATPLTLLEVGKSYTLKAQPKPGFLFDRWTSSNVNHSSPTLTFTMTEGLALTASFAANPYNAANAGSYLGLVTSAPSVMKRHENHGLMNVTITPVGGLTGSLKLGADTFPITGSLHPNGEARFTADRLSTLIIPRQNQRSLVLAMTINPTTRRISGTVAEQGRGVLLPVSQLALVRQRLALAANSSLLKGRGSYIVTWSPVAQQGLSLAEYPQAATSLTGTMTRAGRFTLAGVLGDGSRFTASSSLDEDLALPFSALLHSNAGSLNLRCVFNDSLTTGSFTAPASLWFKPISNVFPYPLGWEQGITFDLSGVTKP